MATVSVTLLAFLALLVVGGLIALIVVLCTRKSAPPPQQPPMQTPPTQTVALCPRCGAPVVMDEGRWQCPKCGSGDVLLNPPQQ